MRYDAFISYRHTPLDMEIAKKVHTGLETYRIPAAVKKKTGKKKMGRVFRDQEELPIGSDLGDNISLAIAESEYLIVICSPRTPESEWVCKEINSFIEMHDRNHVLAVLIEGEPEDSFPPQLLVDENGEAVEPLAADIRGADKRERNNKFKTEILRLAAPVIGCTYDELRQRHRERIIRRTLGIVSSMAGVVALAGAAFGIYNANVAARMTQLADEKTQLADEKTKLAEEITIEYEGKLENQSRFYAEESLSLLEQGYREDAILVALEGLPSKENDRPYVPEAEYALSQSLYAYDSGNTLSYDRNLVHTLPVNELNRTEDMTKIVSIDSSGRVYVWNTADWTLTTMIEPKINEFNYYESVKSADADDTGIYIATDYKFTKYDFEGNELYSKDYTDTLVQCEACKNDGNIVLVTLESVSILDAATGDEICSFENNTGLSYKSGGKYYPNTNLFINFLFDIDSDNSFVVIFDLKNKTVKETPLSEGYPLEFCSTENGNIAVLSCNGDLLHNGVNHTVLDLFDKNGEKLWTREVDSHIKRLLTFSTCLKAHKHHVTGTEVEDIVVTIEAEAFTYDEATGDLINSFNLPGDATMLALLSDSQYGRVGYRQGNIDFIDFREGRIYPEYEIETNTSVRDAVLFENMMVFSSHSSPEVHIITWHEAPDMEDLVRYDERMSVCGASDDSGYLVLRPSTGFDLYFCDINGNDLYHFDKCETLSNLKICNDRTYVSDSGVLWIVDPYNKSEEKIELSDFDFDGLSYEMYIVDDKDAGIIWNSRDIAVIDFKNKKKLYSGDTDSSIGRAILSSDAGRIYVSQGKNNLYAIELDSGEIIEFKNESLKAVASSYDKEFITLSPNDKYIAMCCGDGYVRIADTETLELTAEIPLESYLNAYLAFTDDGSHLIMQGDDYRVSIWDMESGIIKNSIDAPTMIKRIVCDDENGLLALCWGSGLVLCNTDSYGYVALANDGMEYLKANHSIVISSDAMDIKRIYYKDYRSLIELAHKQFPGAALSEEKKVKYNIS